MVVLLVAFMKSFGVYSYDERDRETPGNRRRGVLSFCLAALISFGVTSKKQTKTSMHVPYVPMCRVIRSFS